MGLARPSVQSVHLGTQGTNMECVKVRTSFVVVVVVVYLFLCLYLIKSLE